MNEFLKAMKSDTNYGYTENGGIKHTSTLNKVLDMFALGGSMRNRSNDDVIRIFREAYEEDASLALKCLFYLRDIRGGQGERRFFRVCYNWLATENTAEAVHLLPLVAEYGRYDDLFTLEYTPAEREMFLFLKSVITENKDHLVYKWLKSENCSSAESKRFARKTREAFGLSPREYRKMLTEGRKNCHLVETLMSQNEWDQIVFNKLPSRAGLLYKNAFMRREETRERYAEFMSSKETKVNAGTLNPVDIAHRVLTNRYTYLPATERNALDKYWKSLPDYYHGRKEPGIAVVDVSGSMTGRPMEAAVSMGAYIAERGEGPFKNHFITFSGRPELVEFSGRDVVEKFSRAVTANWGGNTNIEAVFNLLLDTALDHRVKESEMPQTIYIFSDMEFDMCCTAGSATERYDTRTLSRSQIRTVMEEQAQIWRRYGYKLPRIIFWNLDARSQNIPAIGNGFSYVSGFSMNMIEAILSGKDGVQLMLEKLQSKRYEPIHSILE